MSEYQNSFTGTKIYNMITKHQTFPRQSSRHTLWHIFLW